MVKKICSCFMLFLFSAILGFRAYADTPGTVTVTAPENGLYLDVYEVSDIADTDPENKSGVEWISDYIEDNNIAPDYSIESEGNRWILRDLPNGFYYLNLENDDYEMLPITFSMPQADENGKLLSFFEVYPKFDEPGGNNGSHSSSGGSSSNGGWSGGGAYDPDADAENGPGVVKEEESEPETSALPVGGDDSGSSGNGENLSNMDGLNNSQAGGGLIGQLQDMIHGTLSDTGDHADPMLYLLLMAVSMTGIIVTVNFGRKRKKTMRKIRSYIAMLLCIIMAVSFLSPGGNSAIAETLAGQGRIATSSVAGTATLNTPSSADEIPDLEITPGFSGTDSKDSLLISETATVSNALTAINDREPTDITEFIQDLTALHG